MRQQWRYAVVAAVAGLAAISSGTISAQEAAPTPAERIAALKQSLQQSQANLRKVSIGDAPAPAPDQGRGRRGGRLKEKVVENKKDEIQEYMERAVGLVHQYVPPKPEAIDNAKQAGKIAVGTAPGGRASVQFKDFIKAGDLLGVEIDNATNVLAGLFVNSYLDEPADVVALNVQFAALSDGTSYTSQVTLDAKAKNVRVVIQNSGHRPVGQ
jgi:hypothetical protein